MASAYASSAHHSHPTMQSDFRLPSLKDLNFQYRPPLSSTAQDTAPPPPSGPVQPDHPGPNPNHNARHEWPRSAHPPPHPTHMLSSQHTSPVPGPHDHASRHEVAYPPTHSQQPPPPVPTGSLRDDPASHSLKRPRSSPGVGVSPRSSHVSVHFPFPPPRSCLAQGSRIVQATPARSPRSI